LTFPNAGNPPAVAEIQDDSGHNVLRNNGIEISNSRLIEAMVTL
jgi:hypothetical protein